MMNCQRAGGSLKAAEAYCERSCLFNSSFTIHLTGLMTFSQPDPAQLTQTGEDEAGRLRSRPTPKQW